MDIIAIFPFPDFKILFPCRNHGDYLKYSPQDSPFNFWCKAGTCYMRPNRASMRWWDLNENGVTASVLQTWRILWINWSQNRRTWKLAPFKSLPGHCKWTSPLILVCTNSIQKLAWSWTGFGTYILMNTHICNWSPSFRVAIDWRRKGIDKQPEANNKMDTHPGTTIINSLRRRHSWIMTEAIHVRSEAEKIVWQMMLASLRLQMCWNQTH